MNEITLQQIEERIELSLNDAIFNKMTRSYLAKTLKEILCNKDSELGCCKDCIYTLNTDKPFFGVRVFPNISETDIKSCMCSEESCQVSEYKLELDSKLFDLGLRPDEIAAVILYEISSIMDPETLNRVVGEINYYQCANDDSIVLSMNYSARLLFIYAVKDAMYKYSSMMFRSEVDLTANSVINSLGLTSALLSAKDILSSSYMSDGMFVRSPKFVILQWTLSVYKDLTGRNLHVIRETLKDAKAITGSQLEKICIDRVLANLEQFNGNTISEAKTFTQKLKNYGLECLNEVSLFKSLKVNGLRSIEEALYEFSIRIKNCDTEEDAMYILRGINTRLSILEDYLYKTPDLSENEIKKWEGVASQYRALRDELTKKKIWNKKQYGLFFDYDQLDYLDKGRGNQYYY